MPQRVDGLAATATFASSGRPEAAMAKVSGSRVAVDITRDAIQVHGGYGFVRRLTVDGRNNHLESIWRDSKVGEIYEGANEVQLWSIARVA
jgi:alkylation response protein AidB-like acyl-CoA dehydrogenase